MIKRVLIFTLAILVLMPTLVANALVQPSEQVTHQEASRVAKDYLRNEGRNLTPEWNSVQTEEPVLYYDNNGNPDSFIVPLKKKGVEVGFITVSASKEYYPVKEAVETAPLHLKVNKVIKSIENILPVNQKVGNIQFIHDGALEYLAKAEILEGKVVKGVRYFDLMTDKVLPEKYTPVSKKGIPEDQTNVKKVWGKILDPVVTIQSVHIEPGTGATYSDDITDLPSYIQGSYNDCGPTSGAMVLGWWDIHGYTQLQADSDRATGVQLRDALYTAMGTGWDGTGVYGYKNGISSYWQSKVGTTPTTSSANWSSGYTTVWNLGITELGAGRPVGMLIGSTKYGDNLAYNYHWVAGRKFYDGGQGNRFVKVNDGAGYTASLNFDDYWAAKDDIAFVSARP
ncbi:MAG: hypothetical protein M0021_16780 [Clostridia bacterium]|nr:hypothetical protein [Clostridia bacterium]